MKTFKEYINERESIVSSIKGKLKKISDDEIKKVIGDAFIKSYPSLKVKEVKLGKSETVVKTEDFQDRINFSVSNDITSAKNTGIIDIKKDNSVIVHFYK